MVWTTWTAFLCRLFWPKLSQQLFREMIRRAVDYKQNPSDFMDEVMQELEVY